jgi:hypothetical protein
MSNRIYDSSHLTKRRAEKAIAGSFISRIQPPNPSITPQTGYAPLLGIYDNSIMNSVKTGNTTEYSRFPTCIGVSPGCPCPDTNASLYNGFPGTVSDITYTIGSVIVSWKPPTKGIGPFTYKVTPYLNGVALNSVKTTNTSYRFTHLQEWKPYTFTVNAINSIGEGNPVSAPSEFIVPPHELSLIMSGASEGVGNIDSPLKYVINSGLDVILNHIRTKNMGPTIGSRFMYIWAFSIVSAWNWVRTRGESRINGTHDEWDWDSGASVALNDSDSIIWLCNVIDYITPILTQIEYKSIYNCPQDVINRVHLSGEWDTWKQQWQTWYNSRKDDGSAAAISTQPENSANWNETILIDGETLNRIDLFPEPQQWTRLTVNGKKQKYLTHTWRSVRSTCMTETDEDSLMNQVIPKTGDERDDEIDEVLALSGSLTDAQKIFPEFWAGGPGTVSPPLMFIWLWKEYVRIKAGISCTDVMYSLLDLAIHLFEGGRITWGLKALHMESRPIQEIRRRYSEQIVQSWDGLVGGALWLPYQEANFVTPPFADFPSGHSHFSKAFALTMTKWFSENIDKQNILYDSQYMICPLFNENTSGPYGDFVVMPGKSRIQPDIVPSQPIVLSFTTWDDMATSAGLSRLYGGIHARTAHEASQTIANSIHALLETKWNIRKETL